MTPVLFSARWFQRKGEGRRWQCVGRQRSWVPCLPGQTLPCRHLLLYSPLCLVFPPFLLGHSPINFWEACWLLSLWLSFPGLWGDGCSGIGEIRRQSESLLGWWRRGWHFLLCSLLLCVSLAPREIIIQRKGKNVTYFHEKISVPKILSLGWTCYSHSVCDV